MNLNSVHNLCLVKYIFSLPEPLPWFSVTVVNRTTHIHIFSLPEITSAQLLCSFHVLVIVLDITTKLLIKAMN
jgi:hypothetical protein